MSEFSAEKKLELVQQVRSSYVKNRSDMMNREQILYGTKECSQESEEILAEGTLKLRFLLAAVLVITIILMDREVQTLAGFSAKTLFSMMETDYAKEIEAWISAEITIPPLEN